MAHKILLTIAIAVMLLVNLVEAGPKPYSHGHSSSESHEVENPEKGKNYFKH